MQFIDLVKVCLKWFRRPPKPMPAISLGATDLAPKEGALDPGSVVAMHLYMIRLSRLPQEDLWTSTFS